MALANLELSLFAFPQTLDRRRARTARLAGAHGQTRIAPTPVSGLPAFAGTAWALRAMVLPRTRRVLVRQSERRGGAVPVPVTFTASAPTNALALFEARDGRQVVDAPTTPAENAARQGRLANSADPQGTAGSYTARSHSSGRVTGTTGVGNEFGCSLRDT